MAIQTTYTNARANLARLCDHATDDGETVIIQRRGKQDVVLIAADELTSLEETAHLLRSPRNAARLLTALTRALEGTQPADSLDSLRQELGLGTAD